MKILLSALLALPLAFASGAALADHDHGHRDSHGHHDHGPGKGHGHGHGHHDNGWHGRGHPHHWERGHRYTGRVVVVHDYPRYRLRPPPHGYHWVRDDNNDYVLVAIATGIILDYVLN
jgi:Ni/Co efflux regulator RcnB